MSQIFYLGPSFNFMNSRKNNHGKIMKILPFFDIKLKLEHILKFLHTVASTCMS